ncbi:MAG: YciI family protein [Actinomycetota bacterium]
MKYAILIYDEPETLEKMADSGMLHEYDAFANGLVERGQMRGGEQLATRSVTTLRSENGRTIVADGPFAETKEQLGGFFLIECDSLDEALEAAGRVPSLRYGGTVEVRPIVEENMEHH